MRKTRRYGGVLSAILTGAAEAFAAPSAGSDQRKPCGVRGKTCLVTGASSGLGYAVAVELAKRGGRVIVASRSADAELAAEIHRAAGATGAPAVEARRLDLSRFESVETFAAGLARDGIKLDVAVFNAGIVTAESRSTADGFDEMLQVNYLSKFLLVNRLLGRGTIEPSAAAGAHGVPRVIFVSSESHRSGPDIDHERPFALPRYRMRDSIRYYGYSKLLLTTFTEELSRRVNGADAPRLSVFTLCPGAMNTGIAREAPRFLEPAVRFFLNHFFPSPDQAARPVVFLACSPELEGRTDVYLHLMRRKQKDARARDPETGRVLWNCSERAVAREAKTADRPDA
ncbi:MAG: SDR family NAD(P)-dependent oxidoreductase [bacterium]